MHCLLFFLHSACNLKESLQLNNNTTSDGINVLFELFFHVFSPSEGIVFWCVFLAQEMFSTQIMAKFLFCIFGQSDDKVSLMFTPQVIA